MRTGADRLIRVIANAAEAEIDGIEVEIQGRPSERWFAARGINWLNGELSESPDLSPRSARTLRCCWPAASSGGRRR